MERTSLKLNSPISQLYFEEIPENISKLFKPKGMNLEHLTVRVETKNQSSDTSPVDVDELPGNKQPKQHITSSDLLPKYLEDKLNNMERGKKSAVPITSSKATENVNDKRLKEEELALAQIDNSELPPLPPTKAIEEYTLAKQSSISISQRLKKEEKGKYAALSTETCLSSTLASDLPNCKTKNVQIAKSKCPEHRFDSMGKSVHKSSPNKESHAFQSKHEALVCSIGNSEADENEAQKSHRYSSGVSIPTDQRHMSKSQQKENGQATTDTSSDLNNGLQSQNQVVEQETVVTPTVQKAHQKATGEVVTVSVSTVSSQVPRTQQQIAGKASLSVAGGVRTSEQQAFQMSSTSSMVNAPAQSSELPLQRQATRPNLFGAATVQSCMPALQQHVTPSSVQQKCITPSQQHEFGQAPIQLQVDCAQQNHMSKSHQRSLVPTSAPLPVYTTQQNNAVLHTPPLLAQTHTSAIQNSTADQASMPLPLHNHMSTIQQTPIGQAPFQQSVFGQSSVSLPVYVRTLGQSSVPLSAHVCAPGSHHSTVGQSSISLPGQEHLPGPPHSTAGQSFPTNNVATPSQTTVPVQQEIARFCEFSNPALQPQVHTVSPYSAIPNQMLPIMYAPQCVFPSMHLHPNHTPERLATGLNPYSPFGHNYAVTNPITLLPHNMTHSVFVPQQTISVLPPLTRVQPQPFSTVCPALWQHSSYCSPEISHTVPNHNCQEININIIMNSNSSDKQCQTETTIDNVPTQNCEVTPCSIIVTRMPPSKTKIKTVITENIPHGKKRKTEKEPARKLCRKN